EVVRLQEVFLDRGRHHPVPCQDLVHLRIDVVVLQRQGPARQLPRRALVLAHEEQPAFSFEDRRHANVLLHDVFTACVCNTLNSRIRNEEVSAVIAISSWFNQRPASSTTSPSQSQTV